MKKNKFYFFMLLLLFGLLNNNVFAQQYGTSFDLKTTPTYNEYIATDYIRLLPSNDGGRGFYFKATDSISFEASIGVQLDGHNCESAITIFPTDNVKHLKIPLVDTTFWIKFVATDTTIYLGMYIITGDTGFVNQMTLYEAPSNCNSYTQISDGGIKGFFLHYGNLTIGNTYLLKIENNKKQLFKYNLIYSTLLPCTSLSDPNIFPYLTTTVCAGTYYTPIFPDVDCFTLYVEQVLFGGHLCFADDHFGDILLDCPGNYWVYVDASTTYGQSFKNYVGHVTLDPEFFISSITNCTTINFSGSSCITDPDSGTDPTYLGTYTYTYAFGDGIIYSGTDPNPSHTYSVPGTYHVIFSVSYTSKDIPNMSNEPCSGTQSIEHTLVIPATSSITITQNWNINECQIVSLSIPNQTNITHYDWHLPSGTSIIQPTSPPYGNSIVVNWNNIGTNTVTIDCYDENECIVYHGTNDITPPYPNNIEINGSVNCINNMTGNFSFDIPTDPAPPTGTIWQWTVPTGATITSGNGTSSITVDWGTAGLSGDITVIGQYLGCTIYNGTLSVVLPDCSADAQYIADANMNTNTSSDFLATYGTGSIFTTNDKIYINGIFTIDQNISFDGCPNIVMGPNAKIVVNPNRYISITNSHIYGCECLWDGIYVQDPSELVILSNTTAQDAKNAVVSINDGNFHICCNTVFVNNIIGIWVKDYNSESNNTAIPHQGYVSSTYFEYNSSIPMFYDYSQNMIGILVSEVYQLTIGDKTHPLLTNFFRNLKYGIKTTDSDVNIYNNNFDHIGITSSNPPSYSGVYAKPDEAAIFSAKRTYIYYGRPPYLYFTNQINIGDNSGTIQNEFSECNIGVYGENIKPKIENNLIKLQRYTGIHLKDCRDGANINNNVFEMDEDYWALNNLYNSSMIVEFPTASIANSIDIYDNTINETRTGINLSNCGNISSTCNIHDNTINFGTVKIKLNYIGIKSKSGSYENIINNTISYGSIPTINNQSSLRGIELQNVTNSYIRRNNLNSLGTGMSVSGTSTATQFWCNTFGYCYYGISLYGVISSQTYTGNKATDNVWYDLDYPNSYDYRLTGLYLISGQSIYWRHQGTTNTSNIYSPYIVYPDNPLYYSIIAFQNTMEGNACGSNKSSTSIEPTDRTDLLQNIVLDSLIYDTLSAENKYFAKTFAYRFLDDNQAYLNLGTNDDGIYQNFYDTTKVTNIGKLYEVDKLIMNINYAKADSLNSLLTGINLIETNQIEVNRIYLAKLLYDTISSVDSISLVNISYQSSQTGGKGVYGARVILGIDLDTIVDLMPKSMIQIDNNKKTIEGTSDIKVYPNPANDMLYIEFDNMGD